MAHQRVQLYVVDQRTHYELCPLFRNVVSTVKIFLASGVHQDCGSRYCLSALIPELNARASRQAPAGGLNLVVSGR